MEDVDLWFNGQSVSDRLRALIFAKRGKKDLAYCMSVVEMITDLDFPTLEVDDSNPLCHCKVLQSEATLTDEILFDKWSLLSLGSKEAVKKEMMRN